MASQASSGASGSAGGGGGQSTKDAFNAALRSRNAQNNYIAHLKIWENVDAPGETSTGAASLAAPSASSGGSKKARYLIIAVQRDTGKVTVNKAKRNANGSFSIGKDWDLNTLKVVQVMGETSFSLTLARPYSWTTDRPREQHLFLTSLVNVYRKYTRDYDGPRTVGFDVPAGSSSSRDTAGSKQRVGTADSQGSTGSGSNSLDAGAGASAGAIPASASSPPRSHTQSALRHAQLLNANEDMPPRSASAEPAFTRSVSGDGRTSPVATRNAPSDAFYDPKSTRDDPAAMPSSESPTGTSSSRPPLFASVMRRPTMDRKESAAAVLQTAQQRTEAPGGRPSHSSSPLAQRTLLPDIAQEIAQEDPSPSTSYTLDEPRSSSTTSSTSTVVPSAPRAASHSKDKLAQRLARAAAGAATPSSGRSTPVNGLTATPTEPSTATSLSPPSSARPGMHRQLTDSAIRPSMPVRQQSDGSSSSLSVPSSVSNARTRLSAIEPVQARGGKAYERMLLAGTGLKSIGDEDEEEDEEEDEQRDGNAVETLNDDDIYGGAVMGDDGPPASASASPSKRNSKALKGAPSVRRANTTRKQPRDNDGADSDGDDATLVNVEELLEGIDFKAAHKDPGRLGLGLGLGGGAYSAAPGALLSRSKGQGTADVIEASLLSELEALDSANIHSILNGDDRLTSVLNYVDEALNQLDAIDSLVASFKLSLNSRAEDIDFIESQNRGLQVMNSNWRALEREIEQLKQTINVPEHEVQTLLNPNFDLVGAIEAKEAAAASLYKAILQAKTSQMEEHAAAGGMAATTERLGEYSSISSSFGSTMFSHLSAVFAQLTSALLADPSRKAMLQPPKPRLAPHEPIESALGIYCGLMLYVKEVEPKGFERISAAYLTSSSESYREEFSRVIGAWKMSVRRAGEEEEAIGSFAPDASGAGGGGGGGGATSAISRAATVRRLGGGAARKGGRGEGGPEGEVSGAEAFNHILHSVIPLVLHESLFISDFLHLNSNGLTFADYMDLETYFRRRAASIFGQDEQRGGLREMKGAMELIFGFLGGAVGDFIEEVERRDRFQIVGVMGALDAALAEAEDANNEFLSRTLHKLQMKVNASADKFFATQLKAVSMSTATAPGAKGASSGAASYAPSFRGRKSGRGGLTQAVRVLPHFVDRIESQLINAHHLNVRFIVDGFYTQLTSTVVDGLLSIKVDGATATGGQDEDKGVMNHHVLLIENMHHLVQEVNKLVAKAPVLQSLTARAEKMYEDSLSAYVHFVLRRPLGKMMDYGDGIDGLLRSTPANEVSLHSAYSKSSFRKLVKEYTAKDCRKQIDALWRRVLKHFDEDENESFSLSNLPKLEQQASQSVELMLGAQAEEEERKLVVGKVWRRCEADFKREVERMGRIQDDCYKASGVVLEVRVDEVQRLFQR